MTPAEVRAFNAGIRLALAMARHTADVLASSTTRPLHTGFAVEALDAFADAGAALLLPEPIDGAAPAGAPHVR